MRRFLAISAASLFLAALCCAPAAAQELEDLFKKREERGPPVAQYFIATLATMGVLVAVCMPSRKN